MRLEGEHQNRPAGLGLRSCRKLAASGSRPKEKPLTIGYVNERDDWQSAPVGSSSSSLSSLSSLSSSSSSLAAAAAGRSRLEEAFERRRRRRPVGEAGKWGRCDTKEGGGVAAMIQSSSAGLEWRPNEPEPKRKEKQKRRQQRGRSSSSTKEWEVCLINYVRPPASPMEQPLDGEPISGAVATFGRRRRCRIKFKFHHSANTKLVGQKLGKISKLAASNKTTTTTTTTTAAATTRRSPSNRQLDVNSSLAASGSGRIVESIDEQVNVEVAAAAASRTGSCCGSRNSEGRHDSNKSGSSIIAAIYLGGCCQPDARCVASYSSSAATATTDGGLSLWSSEQDNDSDESGRTKTVRWMESATSCPAARKGNENGRKRTEESSYLLNWIAFCLYPVVLICYCCCCWMHSSKLGQSSRKKSWPPSREFKIGKHSIGRQLQCDDDDDDDDRTENDHRDDMRTNESISIIDRRPTRNEIDTANVKKSGKRRRRRGGNECDTNERQRARLRFDRADHAPLPLPLLLLLLSLLVSGPRLASCESAHPKRAVWTRALGVALPSDEPAENVERLADRLTNWPDQQQATLFYLSLLARNSRLLGDSSSWCRTRISLGPLLSSPSSSASFGGQLRPWPSSAAGETKQDEMGAVKLMDKLHTDARFVDLAKLAVENANLISRLLIHQESEVVRRISSQRRFFNYLLETKLKSAPPDERGQTNVLGSVDALGLVFLSDDGSQTPTDTNNHQEEQVLFAPVSRRQPREGERRSPMIESKDLSPELNNKSSLWNQDSGYLRAWLRGGELATSDQLESISGRLLSGEDTDSSKTDGLTWRDGRWFWPQLDCGLSNKWILTYSVPFFGLSSSADTRPKPLALRGIAYVNLDLELSQLGLIDQCAGQQAPVLFGNTHQCANRLKGSQCVSLPPPPPLDSAGEGPEFRGGNYVCQCPPGSTAGPSQRRAVQKHRDRLADIVINPAGAEQSATSPLDKLVLEPEDERLTDKTTKGHHYYYFLAGAQLDADASLQWFASAANSLRSVATEDDRKQQQQQRPGDDSIRLDWPQQVCRRCQARLAASENPHSSQNKRPTVCEPTWSESEPNPNQTAARMSEIEPNDDDDETTATRLDWLRPLILALQSICTLATLCLIGILFRLRKSRVILLSGWLMLETTLLGALILYASVFVRYFEPTSLTCLLEPWLRELGFSIFYGSILIKLYRILTEFQTRKAHRVCFRDKDQVVYLVAIVLIVIGYMSAWTALMVDGFLFGSSSKSGRPLPSTSLSVNIPNGSTSTLSSHAAVILFDNEQTTTTTTNNMRERPTERAANDSNHSSSYPELLPPAEPLSLLALGPNQDDDGLSSSSHSSASASASSSPFSTSSSSRMVDQLAEYAPEQLRIFARNLDSFGQLFSGLLERAELKYDESSESFVAAMRCRKLTWDYVTELSETGLLVFGIYLVYKLRNASGDVHKEKLVLCAPIFIELLVSGCAYVLRHALWSQLSSNQLLALYFVRCQLTVTVSLALVFGPKLWTVCKSKPSLFRQATAAGNAANSSKGSARHRCHLTCEIHDHHLNDAMRLHQAMLSNSALDIGSIDLADMDPDEIQAELKRVYAQLEILKTKVMRRDNPHISKRRGGRKTSHRKFSLQAFHAHRHTSCQSQQSQQNSSSASHQHPAGIGLRSSEAAVAVAGQKLPVLLESQSELSDQAQRIDLELTSQEPSVARSEPSSGRRVRMESNERRLSSPDRPTHSSNHHNSNNNHNHSHHHHHHHNHHQHHHSHHQKEKQKQKQQHHQEKQHQANKCTNERAPLWDGRNLVSGDPNSTGSGGVYLDDSQSSENVSPQRRSSFVCSQSSIHPDDSSVN